MFTRKRMKLFTAIFLSLYLLGGFAGPSMFPRPGAAECAPFDGGYVPSVMATVEKIKPSAWVMRGGKRFELSAGSGIRAFDSVLTGDGGAVTLKFIDGTTVDLSPYSELSILDVTHTPKASRFSVSLAMGGALVHTGGIGLRNAEGVSIATPKGFVRASDAVVWVGVGGGEEIVRIEDMTEGQRVSVYNSVTSEILVTTSPRYGIMTDSENVMRTVELAPR
ncbi:MAG: FecR domain-containing protein [Synergistaceae bacterium]|nr:FecR domain-containing protein [Synergistaceae bacterium]